MHSVIVNDPLWDSAGAGATCLHTQQDSLAYTHIKNISTNVANYLYRLGNLGDNILCSVHSSVCPFVGAPVAKTLDL